MTDEGRSPNLLIRVLVGICLALLLANVVRDYQGGRLPGIGRTRGSATTVRPWSEEGRLPHRSGQAPRVVKRSRGALTSIRRAPRRARPVAVAVRQAHRPERSRRVAALPKPQRAAAPTLSAPPSLTLKPLGYIEQPDGKKIAVLPEGEHVALVPEGEVFAGRYRAVEVSAQAVTLRDELGAIAGKPPPELIAVITPAATSMEPAAVPVEPLPADRLPTAPGEAAVQPTPAGQLGSEAAVAREDRRDPGPPALRPSVEERLLPGSDSEASPARPLMSLSTAEARASPDFGVSTRSPPTPRLPFDWPLRAVSEVEPRRAGPSAQAGPPAQESQRAPPRTIWYGAAPESRLALRRPDEVHRGSGGQALHQTGRETVRLLGVIESVPGQMQAAVEWGGEVRLLKEGDVLPEGDVVSKISPGTMVVRPAMHRMVQGPAASAVTRSKEVKGRLRFDFAQRPEPVEGEAGATPEGGTLVFTCCGYSGFVFFY